MRPLDYELWITSPRGNEHDRGRYHTGLAALEAAERILAKPGTETQVSVWHLPTGRRFARLARQ